MKLSLLLSDIMFQGRHLVSDGHYGVLKKLGAETRRKGAHLDGPKGRKDLQDALNG